MMHPGKIVLTTLLFALLPGCASRNTKVKPPVIARAPTTNDQTGVMYPSPFPQKTEAPALPAPEPTQIKEAPPAAPPPTHKLSMRRKNSGGTKAKPSAAKPPASSTAESTTIAAPSGTPSAPAQRAANVEPSGVSPIGQLSSGAGAAGSQKRHDTSDLINTTEQGLNGIKRSLSTQEHEITGQIRTYLKQARQALTVDDIDGASTLATKAKVLLEELTKP